MPTLDEWQQALVTPQTVIVESSNSLIQEVRQRQNTIDAKRASGGKPRPLEGPECGGRTHVTRSLDTHDRDMPNGPDEQPTNVGVEESDIDQILADSFPLATLRHGRSV